MHLYEIRKHAQFVDRETGERIDILQLRKAKPIWFVLYRRPDYSEDAISYAEFRRRFAPLVRKERS